VVIVVDTSAIAAILFQEPDAAVFETVLGRAERCAMSAVTRVELSCVVEGRKGEAGRQALEDLLDLLRVEVVPVDLAQVHLAISAFRSFGKGRHPAGLNIGDCFSYALSKSLGEPLLFKGADFMATDVARLPR
jgi:ribonuclease VapC